MRAGLPLDEAVSTHGNTVFKDAMTLVADYPSLLNASGKASGRLWHYPAHLCCVLALLRAGGRLTYDQHSCLFEDLGMDPAATAGRHEEVRVAKPIN